MRGNDVIVYSAPHCKACELVKSYLRDRGVRYEEVDISLDQEAREAMVRMTGQMGVPVAQLGDRFVIGFSRRRLDELLQNCVAMV